MSSSDPESPQPDQAVTLPAVPELADIRDWIARAAQSPVEWLGPAESPVGVAAWYRTHLQSAEIRRAHGMSWLVLECTFCVHPRRPLAVLPLVAQANLQLESGRWYRLPRPTRLACAVEVPAHGITEAHFAQVWQRFHDDVLTHGIELTLRTRADAWVHYLAEQGRAPAGYPRPKRRKSARRQAEAT